MNDLFGSLTQTDATWKALVKFFLDISLLYSAYSILFLVEGSDEIRKRRTQE